jgi:predicted ATPase
LQEQLASLVAPALSVNTISNVERGRTRPYRRTLDALATALELDAHQRAELAAAWRAWRGLGAEAVHEAEPASLPPLGKFGGAASAVHLPNATLRPPDARPHNLPVALTGFVGREQELAAITEQLRSPEVRVLTLTGAGGIGKTRLALQAAAELIDGYSDGVFFVSLASITDPNLVESVITQALGMPDAGSSPRDSLCDFLHDKELLLVLDNFEHLTSAASLVVALLADAPRLNVLVTSREILRVSGEHNVGVPPLSLPTRTTVLSLEQLTHNEAVRLFIERARAVKSDFQVTNANALTVTEICHKLDGLPLAIELAAARVRHLAPEALLPRLERRLLVLTGGPHDLPVRQQTLRDTITWSYDLLASEEQALFRRLAVFAGGFTLDAAEAVCALDRALTAIDVLNGVASLIDKSLLRPEPTASGETRYAMLETVREYGLEQLVAAGEDAPTRARQVDYFEAFVQRAAPHFLATEQLVWLARMDDEWDNMRVVLQWLLDHNQGERGQSLGGLLWYYFGNHGRVSEGRMWLTRFLDRPTNQTTGAQARGRALFALGLAAAKQYDTAASDVAFTESLALARAAGDAWTTAMALVRSAWTSERLENMTFPRQHRTGDRSAHLRRGPAECYEEALDIVRHLCDDWGSAVCLAFYAQYLHLRDAVRARKLATEALDIASKTGDRWALAFSLGQLVRLAVAAGERTEAKLLLQRSLALSGELNDLYSEGLKLGQLAQLEMDAAEFAVALALNEQRVAKCRQLGNRAHLAHALHDLAIAARLTGDLDRGLRAYEDCLALFQTLEETGDVAALTASMGHLHRQYRNRTLAAAGFAESLRALNSQNAELGIATALAGLGGLALDEQRLVDAARLLGTIEAVLERLQASSAEAAVRLRSGLNRFRFLRDTWHVQELRTEGRLAFEGMGTEAFEAALDAARVLSTAEAVALGLELALEFAGSTVGDVSSGVDGAPPRPDI